MQEESEGINLKDNRRSLNHRDNLTKSQTNIPPGGANLIVLEEMFPLKYVMELPVVENKVWVLQEN